MKKAFEKLVAEVTAHPKIAAAVIVATSSTSLFWWGAWALNVGGRA